MRYDKQKWIVMRDRYIPALWPVNTYWDWDLKNFLNVKTSGRVIHIWDKGHYTGLHERKPFEDMANSIIKKLKSQNIENIRRFGIKTGEKVVTECIQVIGDVVSCQVPDFILALKKIRDSYIKIMKYNFSYWFLATDILANQIEEKLSNVSNDNKSYVINTMSHPSSRAKSESIYSEFESILKDARKFGKDSKKVNVLITDFSKKYFWFPYEYVGPGIWDEKSVKQRLSKEINTRVKNQEKTNVLKKQNECIKKYNLSHAIINDFKILQTLTLMQDDRKMFNSQICYYINHVLFSKLSTLTNTSLNQARYIDDPLLELFVKNKKEFKRRLKKRSEFLVLEHKDNKNAFYEGKAGIKYLRSLNVNIREKESRVTELEGKVANNGIAKGYVRIAKTSHIKNFEEGNILVTGMTTPDYIQLIKKAGAIVTNEGGITCHAAIISRELKKPCIIGTKIATKVFKDGDYIEVDANKGIVRKIK